MVIRGEIDYDSVLMITTCEEVRQKDNDFWVIRYAEVVVVISDRKHLMRQTYVSRLVPHGIVDT